MIYLTGDTHGLIDIDKLDLYFWDKDYVTKDDYLIILGDVGCLWDGGDGDRAVQKKLHDLPCTVLWIDGNHENFDLMACTGSESAWNGGRVQIIQEDIKRLLRGQIYEIEGHKFWTMGGGNSIDRIYRQKGVSWWSQEMPSREEYEEGTKNLERVDYKVDYILTHTCPETIGRQLVNTIYPGEEELQRYLEFIANEAEFKDWYFGHWHVDKDIGKFHALYNRIIKLGENEE